jgi:hypothetical protein
MPQSANRVTAKDPTAKLAHWRPKVLELGAAAHGRHGGAPRPLLPQPGAITPRRGLSDRSLSTDVGDSAMSEKLDERRKRLLIKLESIIGNECYNANIQNWGPEGVFEGEGREFRYPVTFRDQEGNKFKKRCVNNDLPDETLLGGYYAFGANELHVVAALNKILDYLEKGCE